MSAPSSDENSALVPQLAPSPKAELRELSVEDVVANDNNPRLDFPQDELDRLAESIDHEGVLVRIVVYPKGDKYVLVDGERRFRTVRDLGLETVPAVITTERTEREVLQQMFNIHLIREPWRDIPTARALDRLVKEMEAVEGREPNDKELRELTGLSIERVRQLRYVVKLPEDWQAAIRSGEIPLNYFWEMQKNVLSAMRKHRPELLDELGEENVAAAFVAKRQNDVITDTVSLRRVAPIIKFAAEDASRSEDNTTPIDDSIRALVNEADTTIDDTYEDTVQLMIEVDKLGRRTSSMVAAFGRLLEQSTEPDDREAVVALGRDLIEKLGALIDGGDAKS